MADNVIYDGLATFEAGMNAGIAPMLLDKNQLAFATNATVRGSFVSPRPPFRKMALEFLDYPETMFGIPGLWQGACPYVDDLGNGSLMAQIGGRLLQFVISGSTAQVHDRTAPGDPNPGEPTQAWMWQSENYVIVQDGRSIPVIFDGSASRRAHPAPVDLAQVDAAGFVVPAIGSSVQITLTGPFPPSFFNQVVLIDNVSYVITPPSGNPNGVTLENLTDTGSTVPAGTAVRYDPANLGPLALDFTVPTPDATVQNQVGTLSANIGSLFPGIPAIVHLTAPLPSPLNTAAYVDVFIHSLTGVPGQTPPSQWIGYQLPVTSPGQTTFSATPSVAPVLPYAANAGQPVLLDPNQAYDAQITVTPGVTTQLTLVVPATLQAGDGVLISGGLYEVTQRFSATSYMVKFVSGGPPAGWTIPAGTSATWSGNHPGTQVGVVGVPFTIPAAGHNVNAVLQASYTSAVPLVVWVGSSAYWLIAGNPPPAASNVVLATNVNDTQTATPVHANALVVSLPEIPVGRMGAYGMGRNWVSLPNGRQFVASDIVGGASGSAQFGLRDSVLKFTENTYLAGGGAFSVPGSGGAIHAMTFSATLDASLGQGPLQVLTPNVVFSCNAPVDRNTWQSITNPILTEALISYGGTGQNSTVVANSDVLFRAVDGWRSLLLSQRDFAQWGQTPISLEVLPVVQEDNPALLPYASAVVFDNRFLATANPVQGGLGVYHDKLVALNFDPMASLRGKLPSVYDGIWDGLNVLQLTKVQVAGVERAFAFCYNLAMQEIELWEILPTKDENFDPSTTWEFETGPLFINRPDPYHQFLRLNDGELYVFDIRGRLNFEVFFRSDFDPDWHAWRSWSVNAGNPVIPTQFMRRMGLGNPPTTGDAQSGLPYREGYFFFVKVRIKGACVFGGSRFAAVEIPQPKFAPVLTSPITAP